MLTRRSLIAAVPGIAAAGGLAACATSTNGNVTTVKLNVASMNAWGQALVNGAELVATLPGFTGTPAALAILAVGPVIAADMTAFNNATGGSLTFTYDKTSPATQVTSIVNDAQDLANKVTAAVSQIPAGVVSNFQQYAHAILTIVSLIQAAIGSMTAAAAPGGMTEAQALAVLSKH